MMVSREPVVRKGHDPAVAIVAGATSEIGAAIARALARDGHQLAIHHHSDDTGAAMLANELAASGTQTETVRADVSSLEEVQAMHASLSQTLGSPSILVNASALIRFERFLDSAPSGWHDQVDVTLIGAMNLIWVFAKGMVERGHGRIVTILAEGALVGEPALAVASATKGGVLGLTRALARDFARYGVTVNGVSPGFVPTKSVPERFRTPERLEAISRQYPARRLGTPEEIAEAVAFLASARAAYVTGQTISVSGGYSVR